MGVSLRYAIIPTIIIVLSAIFIIWHKYKGKIALVSLCLFLLGVGVSFISFDYKTTNVSGFVIERSENYFVILSKGEKLYTYQKDHQYEIGDYLNIKGEKKELEDTSIESQFNFKNYLNKKGVKYEIEDPLITTKFSNPVRISILKKRLLSHFSDNQASFISSLLFSDFDESEINDNLKYLHLGKFASATGLYLYAYLSVINYFISLILKNKKWSILSLITLIPYFVFTFPRLTIIRIFVLEILRYININFLNKRFRSIQITGLVGIIFILIDYHFAYQTSFILGFLIPFIMVLLRGASYGLKKFKKKIVEIVGFEFFFIPFEISFYNSISPLSWILQILLSPLFILIAVFSLACFYHIPIYWITGILIDGASNILKWMHYISYEIYSPPMKDYFLLIYYALFTAICYYRSLGFKIIHRPLLVGLISIIIFYHLPTTNLVSEQVSFINVGQGDSCLIRKGNSAILIDTGGLQYMDIAKESLIPYLKKQRIYNIDLVITTHDDYDHMGGLDSLKENFRVKKYINDDVLFPVTINGITFTNYNNHIDDLEEENDKSLVIGFHLVNKDFLVMGDAPIKVERNMIDEYKYIPCDILKVGHHGSDTSTCDEFIKYIKPETAIISAGKNNRYGHPKPSVIKTLKRNNVEIRYTFLEGTITYRKFSFSKQYF